MTGPVSLTRIDNHTLRIEAAVLGKHPFNVSKDHPAYQFLERALDNPALLDPALLPLFYGTAPLPEPVPPVPLADRAHAVWAVCHERLSAAGAPQERHGKPGLVGELNIAHVVNDLYPEMGYKARNQLGNRIRVHLRDVDAAECLVHGLKTTPVWWISDAPPGRPARTAPHGGKTYRPFSPTAEQYVRETLEAVKLVIDTAGQPLDVTEINRLLDAQLGVTLHLTTLRKHLAAAILSGDLFTRVETGAERALRMAASNKMAKARRALLHWTSADMPPRTIGRIDGDPLPEATPPAGTPATNAVADVLAKMRDRGTVPAPAPERPTAAVPEPADALTLIRSALATLGEAVTLLNGSADHDTVRELTEENRRLRAQIEKVQSIFG